MADCAVGIKYRIGSPESYQGVLVYYTDERGDHVELFFCGRGPVHDWQHALRFITAYPFGRVCSGETVTEFLDDAGFDLVLLHGVPTMIPLILG